VRALTNQQQTLTDQQQTLTNQQQTLTDQQQTLTNQQQTLTDQQQTLTSQQESLATQLHDEVTNVMAMVNIMAQNADRHWEAFMQMQAEIRGLQTENRRILERLEAHMRDDH
jgi:predicted  nucleic acid-binding Zn-ribbon protein